MYDQFQRVELLLGSESVKRIRNAFVVVLGLGAVGGFATEALARSGVGKLRLVDHDKIKESNLNRQILATWNTIGIKKCIAAKDRVLSINPHCAVEDCDLFMHKETLPEILAGNPDIVVDAIDSLNPKTEVLAALIESGQTGISSMGAALRTDPTKIQVGNLAKITHCPLASMLRKRLRRRGIEPNITSVYSNEETRLYYRDAILPPEMSEDNDNELGRRRTSLGSLPTITGIFGLTIANWVLMRLSGENDCTQQQ